jgi:hypothetical protein
MKRSAKPAAKDSKHAKKQHFSRANRDNVKTASE